MYHYIFFINLVLKYIYIYRYTYICRSVGLSVCRSVGLSVCRSVGLSVIVICLIYYYSQVGREEEAAQGLLFYMGKRVKRR